MILSDTTIRERQLVEPFNERKQHNGMSYGLGPASYDVRSNDFVTIKPGGCALISTVEFIKIPPDCGAVPITKSTWLREGLQIALGWFDPGFEGHGTFLATNHGPYAVTIRPLDPIAQMVFMRLDKPVSKPYGGKYFGLGASPVSALYEDDGA